MLDRQARYDPEHKARCRPRDRDRRPSAILGGRRHRSRVGPPQQLPAGLRPATAPTSTLTAAHAVFVAAALHSSATDKFTIRGSMLPDITQRPVCDDACLLNAIGIFIHQQQRGCFVKCPACMVVMAWTASQQAPNHLTIVIIVWACMICLAPTCATIL